MYNRSWLGRQFKMGKEIDGLAVKLPSMTRNLQTSWFMISPHFLHNIIFIFYFIHCLLVRI